MASHTETFVSAASPEAIAAALPGVTGQLGWTIDRMEPAFEAKERFSLFSFSWPTKVRVDLYPQDAGSAVAIHASNFGFGPIQSRKVKQEALRWRAALEAV